ncbi:o-succinylbenzoate--CoA ligase [Shewanella halotolerans]|uniref:o-succinylbenzoate--CoA ligase n=1 Tax=Shewanella halotolerans TaxID=2864204 RepID=UPI001C65AEE1|nr:o-succinylbenzoate--CoA ligase [Shewanella halotolerans]QYJ89812.1 o-succinylbenzoate--CoA ligase [Shewanella halotolerans]
MKHSKEIGHETSQDIGRKSIDTSPLHLMATKAPGQVALHHWQDGGYRAIDYAQLSQRIRQCARQLHDLGVTSGDKLACVDQNSLALVILYWACIDLGAIFCPLNPRFPKAQIAAIADRYGFKYFWAGEAYQALLPEPGLTLTLDAEASLTTTRDSKKATKAEATKVEPTKVEATKVEKIRIDTARPCNIILTSGSSGMPKAAVHCLNNHIASALGSTQKIPLACGDNWLLSLPLFHIGGLAIVNRCALAGAALTLPAPGLSLAKQLKAMPLTHLSLVATQLVRLLNDAPESLKGLKALLLGGSAMDEQLIERLTPLGIPAFTSYGMTEMSSQITTARANAQGSCGMPLPGRQLNIIDEVIYVRGETLFLGYLGDKPPHSIARPLDDDGWFCTQDRGRFTPEGELLILGRTDNMFICGGENVQPEEIEAVLRSYPGIEEALVFGVADEEFGLLPVAIIKGEVASLEKLEGFLCQHIARFKRPRRYFPWPEVEQTGLKLPRKLVIQAVAERHGLATKKPA